ncbi:MAG: DUF5035 domain-containing protein [Bacteroides sp.]|nr:DUF5035 domain-containing protein [Bacteroides sp.]
MNKILLILSLFTVIGLSGCTDSDADDTPLISVLGIYLNDDDTDYAYDPEELPVLTRNDVLTLIMQLDGKGAELKSFYASLVEGEDGDLSHVVRVIISDYEEDHVTDDSNFTNPEDGRVGFVDGVTKSQVTAQVKIRTSQENEAEVGFYLSSRAKPDQGGEVKLLFQTGERIEIEPEPEDVKENMESRI